MTSKCQIGNGIVKIFGPEYDKFLAWNFTGIHSLKLKFNLFTSEEHLPYLWSARYGYKVRFQLSMPKKNVCSVSIHHNILPIDSTTHQMPAIKPLFHTLQPCHEHFDIHCDDCLHFNQSMIDTAYCKRPAMNPELIKIGNKEYIRVSFSCVLC